MPTPFLFPMTGEDFKEISEKLGKRISKEMKELGDYLLDHMPGLDQKSGREKLAFYRTTDAAYWERLTAINRDRAKSNLLEWGALSRRYPR